MGCLFFVPEQSFARDVQRVRAAQNRIFCLVFEWKRLSKTGAAVRRKRRVRKTANFGRITADYSRNCG